jgi:ATP-dependent Lon protease
MIMGNEPNTKNKKRDTVIKASSSKKKEKQLSKKHNEESDSDDDIVSEEESDDESGEGTSGDMDVHEYRKFLQKIFPSKYLNDKIKKNESKSKKKSSSSSPDKKKKRKRIIESESEDDEEEDDEYEEEEIVTSKKHKKNQKFNLIFTIGDPSSRKNREEEYDSDEDDESDDSDYEEYEDDEEEDEYETEDSEEDEYSEDESESDEEENSKTKKTNKNIYDHEYYEKEIAIIDNYITTAEKQLESNKKSKVIQDMISIGIKKKEDIVKLQNKSQKKERGKNLTKFKKTLRGKNPLNDYSYFKKMDVVHQQKIITEVEEMNKIMSVDKPYRLKLLEADIPATFKACALKKINTLRYMEPGGGEYYKMKTWVDTFMNIPFNKYNNLNINIDDGVDKCHEFMEQAKGTLDSAVYGLNDAKLQIMQLVGQWITNPTAIGTAIAIKGPPGTGKTTLVKDGISKILGREFAFIALGGATDSSYLEGHSYTYEGSSWGKIIDILVQCKSMNPVIYFDELDKISDTPKGEEIAGILTHLTDTSQNTEFHDKYFSEINFDLSKCLFIFSYNDESRINPILRDRMYRIQTDGYSEKQKIVIARDYLIPKIREQIRFTPEEVVLEDEIIGHVIQNYTADEKGVRNMKRCLEIIFTKLNLYRLMKPGTNMFEEDMKLKVEFPIKVTQETVRGLIERNKDSTSLYGLYV